MFALRHVPSKKYLRVQPGTATNLVADRDLETGEVLSFPDLWAVTQFVEKQLKGQPVEIVELGLREVRVIPPVINVKKEKPKPNAPTGNQLSKPDGI
jgi:hypothetical protein